MKKIVFFASLLFAGSAVAEQVDKVWESETVLKGPESVLFDGKTKQLYVSSINGDPNEKNGLGFVSKLSTDGKVDELKWLEGLNGPKGMVIVDEYFYVADIDTIVKFDLASGKRVADYPAEGAKFLNDLAVDGAGNVYVTDMAINRIYRLEGDNLNLWLEGEVLENPNGIQVIGDTLYLGTWGIMTNGFETDVPGRVKLINIHDKSIKDFAGKESVGNIDGLVVLDDKNVLISNWMLGGLYNVNSTGSTTELIDLEQGSADLGWNESESLIYVPMMLQNQVVAYRLNK